jgi:serine protease Do
MSMSGMRFGLRNAVVATAIMVMAAGLSPGSAEAQVSPAMKIEDLPSVADLAARLLPAVVEITVKSQSADSTTQTQLPDLPDNSPFKDFFDEFFKRHRQDQNQGQGGDQGGGDTAPPRTLTSMGSGFVIDASGIIVTNNHVVEGAKDILVHFHDDTILNAELVGRDPKTDVAVLRVKAAKPLPTVGFGDSDKARIGEWALAIGNPFGLGGSVSLGIISARNRDINAGPYDDFIQTDAAINKGNSGGPLFDLKGEVVGINTAIFSPSGGSVGIGFAVPSNTAKVVVDQLIKYGETRRGWLGVKIQSVTDDIASAMGMDHPYGALIADVTKTGPAEKAGIESGDVVVEFNGHPIAQMRDLPRMVAETEVGSTAQVKVLRKGKEMSFTVEIGRLENGEKLAAQPGGGAPAPAAPAAVTVLGMTVTTLTDELRTKYSVDKDIKGAVVTEVAQSGPAADKHIEPGDVITEAGEKPVEGAADISARIAEAKQQGKNSLLLLVAKGGKQTEMRFFALKLAP